MRDGGRIAAAIEVLDAVMTHHRPVKDALRDWGKTHRFAGSGDRAWISGLVLDALRWRGRIRHMMGQDTPRALILGALSAAWQMETSAISACFVDDEHAPESLNDEEIAALDRGLDETAPLWVRADLPEWLSESFERAYGDAAEAEGQTMAGRAPVDLRLNTLKADADKAEREVTSKLKTAHRHDWVLNAIRIPETDPRAKSPGAENIPAYGKGWVEVQDTGSQLAALAAGPIEGLQVFDYCAGAGGKTLALAAQAGNTGQVYAWDYDGRRLRAIWPRLKRAGARNVQVREGKEAEVLADLKGSIDLVFVDAPCTGSGTWRRRPDAKWRLKPNALEKRMAEQDEVLAKASTYVKPGGRMVYVTCSVLPEENEDRVEAFLNSEAGAGFATMPASQAMASSGGLKDDAEGALRALEGRFDAVQLSPHRSQTDGFYVCVLERTA